MGIFTGGNRVTGTVEPLAEATGYRGTLGAAQALIENVQNERALFNAIIESDFQEVNMLREGAEIEALTESAIIAMGSKIKEFLKKAWEKIKALVSSFITMIMTVIIRDNKKLVDKYRTEVVKKDLTKFKFKWSECKGGKDIVFDRSADELTDVLKPGEVIKSEFKLDEADVVKLSEATTKAKSRDFKEKVYKDVFDLDIDDLLKSAKESDYKDLDTIEGMSGALLRNIMSELTESKTVLKGLNKAKTDSDKVYKENLKKVDDLLKTEGKNKDASDVKVKQLNLEYAIFATEQEIAASILSTGISLYKWKIKECRAAFARAAAFNEKLVKENAELEDAMDDVQHGIIDDLFENEMFA